jgi:chromosome partitioning protein
MHVIAILSQKGGTGKTTLSLHLAVAAERAGHVAAVIDLDPQASAAGWTDSRPGETPAVVSMPATRLPQALDLARGAGAEVVFLDTAPHSSDVALAAAEAADLLLIPCRAGILDLRAIGATARLAKIAGKPVHVILNSMPPRATNIITDAREAVRVHGLDVAPVTIQATRRLRTRAHGRSDRAGIRARRQGRGRDGRALRLVAHGTAHAGAHQTQGCIKAIAILPICWQCGIMANRQFSKFNDEAFHG